MGAAKPNSVSWDERAIALGKDRRTSARILETLPVKLKGRALQAHLFSLDVGLGGIRIFWNWPLVVGSQYDLSIALTPLKTWIGVRAQVLWQVRVNRRFEIAMKFVDVSPADRQKLEQYVEGHGPKNGFSRVPDGVSSVAEKRKDQRVSGCFPVAVWPASESPVKVSSGLVVDLSMSGARFVGNAFFLGGEEISLRFQLGTQQAVLLSGTIVRSNRLDHLKRLKPELAFLHAVKFDPYSDEIKRILEGYIDYRNSNKELNLAHSLLNIVKN